MQNSNLQTTANPHNRGDAGHSDADRLFAGRSADIARAQLAACLVSYASGVPLAALAGTERGAAAVAHGRQVAMYLAHTAFEMSLARVANAFGRDRSTVAHACHRVEDRRDDPAFDRWIEDLEAVLRAAPSPANIAVRR